MEANLCDINHLDADVLLPPRKRLLAGFKKRSPDNCDAAPHPPVVASSSSSASPSSPSFPSPSPAFLTPCSPSSNEFQIRLNNLLSSHFNESHNLSPEQIVEASKSAADTAVKAAEVARAAAQQKAMTATKAVTAAKSALALVASFPEEADNKERHLRKNKLKKHVQVQLLYKKHQPIENHRDDDEELARKLHRVMNSSPRISMNSYGSDCKGHKNKKPKSLPSSERSRVSNGNIMLGGNTSSICNGHAVAGELDSEGSIEEVYTTTADASKCEKGGQPGRDNGEAESSNSKEKNLGDARTPGKKRGRLKLKKFPLSICNHRDKANPAKEDMFQGSLPLTDKNMGNPASCNNKNNNKPSVETAADNRVTIETTPMWKCQDFKARIKQNKVGQS